MSNRNARVFALAGAAALAGIGYTLVRRSAARSHRLPRVSTRSFRRGEAPSNPGAALAGLAGIATVAATEPSDASDSERISSAPDSLDLNVADERISSAPDSLDLNVADGRISSAPDALDIALDLSGVFDVESASRVPITARPSDHVPALRTGDDEEAPAPEDLGRAWLIQATESEHSLGTADTIPDVENLPRATSPEADGESDIDGIEFDEPTAEYVNVHGTLRPIW